MIRHIVYKLQDWLLPLRLRLGQKLLYSKDFKIVRVSRSELIKGPCLSQELEAMEYVSANTTICLPRIHRTYTRADGLYIAMDFVRGDRLDDLWPHISDEEKRKLVSQVQEVVAKLHECAPPVALGDVAVASARGGPVSDGAFGIEGHRAMVRGPFQDVDGFEERVLTGAKETILKHKPVLVIEDDKTIAHSGVEYCQQQLNYKIVAWDKFKKNVVMKYEE